MAERDPNLKPDKDPQGTNPWMKSLFIWAGILLALILFVQVVDGGGRAAAGSSIAYSDFLNRVDSGSVKDVQIGKDVITGKLNTGETFKTNAIPDPELTSRLRQHGVDFSGQPEATTSVWLILLYQ